MTIGTTVWAFKQDLPCVPKFVLVVLCDGAGMAREIRIDGESLGTKCGLSVSELREALAELEDRGAIEGCPNGRVRLCYPLQDFEIGSSGYSRDQFKAGSVYIIEAYNGLTKVGVSSSVSERIRALGFSAGVEVKLAWQFDCTMGEARKFEKTILAHFESVRIKGEWLRANAGDVVAVARTICGASA